MGGKRSAVLFCTVASGFKPKTLQSYDFCFSLFSLGSGLIYLLALEKNMHKTESSLLESVSWSSVLFSFLETDSVYRKKEVTVSLQAHRV